MPKVFLGGTVNGSKWRDYAIKQLKIDFYNPVVPEWNDQAHQRELFEREHCDYCLYVITPKMTGYYSIAEVVEDSNKRPQKTVYCLLCKDGNDEFEPIQIKALQAVGRVVENNGGKWLPSLDDTVAYLNTENHY